jgi:4-amino-4-deoxy-L-arabinose transferase-like glycosyltransferase
VRTLSLVPGALTVAAVLALARSLAPSSVATEGLAGLFVATLPQFAFIHATVSNDPWASLFVALGLLALVRLIKRPLALERYVLLGTSLGLGLVTKKTLLFLVPVSALALAAVVCHERAQRGRVLRGAAMALAVAGLVAGWWYVRNLMLYGDLWATGIERSTNAGLVSPHALLSSCIFIALPAAAFRSFIDLFGWLSVSLPAWAYAGYAGVLCLALIGAWLATGMGGRGQRARRVPDAAWLIGPAAVLAAWAGVVVYNLTYTQPQGRFLFPVLPAIAVLTARGLAGFAGGLRGVPRRVALPALAGWLVAVDIMSLVTLVGHYA